ncbi:MAG: hypothetical protein ACW99U_06355 [Candidatus Thorarchaeota archaeon]|jgi:hypothetical protein
MIEETQSVNNLQEKEIPLSSIWKSPLESLVHGLVVESVAYLLLVALELAVGLFWVLSVVPPEYGVMQIPIYVITVLSVGCAMGFINQIVSGRLWSFRRPYSRRVLCAQGMILLTFSAFLMDGFLRIISSTPLEWISFSSPLISLAAIMIIILTSPLYAFVAINLVSWDVNLHDERGRSEAFGAMARCGFCEAVYVYKEEDIKEGRIVNCQNCSKDFKISSSTNSYEER